MTSVRNGFFLSMAERYILIAISLASNILLARMLTPKEIGIYSVSLAVIGIAQVLRDFGIGNFLIQEKNLTDDHVSTAFGVSLIFGGVLFIAVWAAASYAAEFYHETRMIETMRISSVNFLVLPFCTVSLALLRRAMAFDRLVYVTLFSTSISFAVTITLAYSGFGPNSMAVGAVVGNVTIGLGSWLARDSRKLLLPNFSEWRAILKFGGQSSLARVVGSIAMDASELVIGKMLGLSAVAITSRAKGLMYIFHRDLLSSVRNVALPAFSAIHHRGDEIDSHHTRSVALLTVFAWPFYGFVSLYALEALRLMFGPQWDEAAQLVPIYCFAGAVSVVNSLIPILMIAVGRIDLITRTEVVLQSVLFILIAVAASVFQTVMACAIAYLVSSIIALPVFIWCKSKALHGSSRGFVIGLLPSVWVSSITLLPSLIHVYVKGFSRTVPINLIDVLAVCLVGFIFWIVSVRFLCHPLGTDPLFCRFFNFLPLGGRKNS